MRLARGIVSVISAIVLWELLPRLGLVRPALLPPFSAVLIEAGAMIRTGEMIPPLIVSLARAFGGLGLAVAVGVPVGAIMARARWARWFFEPIISVFLPAPKIAFLPIFISLFGIGDISKTLLVAFNCVFPIVVSTMAGVATVPIIMQWAARTMGCGPVVVFIRILMPAAFSSLLSGLRIAIPLALLTTFTAEMVGGGGGLGGNLMVARRFFESEKVYVYIVAMLVCGYLIDVAFLRARRYLLRWDDSEQR